MRTPRSVLALVLVAVALLAALAREVHNERITVLPAGDPGAGWFSFDPDTHYQLRRLTRVLDEGLPVAGRDERLNHPEGAAIPWPPYYTLLLAALLGPSAPSDPALRADYLERTAASLPWHFGVATALVAALAAWRLLRGSGASNGPAATAALLAGGIFALLGSSLHYSAPGNGDHHAFATSLMAGMFALVAEGARSERLASPRAGLGLGCAAGVLAGALLGSWVGGLVHVLIVQAVLGWLVLRAAREHLPGLAPFGLAFHLTAAAVLAPAVLASPWNELHPWMVVNLSWFHLAHLLLGALVFAPLLVTAPGTRARRAWPWIVLAALALLALGLALSDLGPARGVREGFAWARRANGFMEFIAESQPLLWGQDGSMATGLRLLGLAPLALAIAWFPAARRAFVQRDGALLVWVVAAPPLLIQALVQRRFAEALGPAMAVLVGWGAGWLLARRARVPQPLICAALALLAAGILEYPTLARGATRLTAGEHWLRGPQASTWRGQRALYRWLAQTPSAPGAGVLAPWYHGHSVLWVADRPSVATNFGSFVGLEGYLAPWRFFLERDPARAEALLVQRDARFVLVDGALTNDLAVMLSLLRDEVDFDALARTPDGLRPSAQWYATQGARLAFEGRAVDPTQGTATDSLDYLRLVHVSAQPYALPLAMPYLPPGSGAPPCGWIWERVAGARVEARGAPGQELRLSIEIVYPQRERVLLWTRAATCDAQGLARLRVPYATDEPNGDGRALGPARWTLGERSGNAEIPGISVLAGSGVSLP
jgi:asparagine N-glycosylation enzyme membrane subunit Stt3